MATENKQSRPRERRAPPAQYHPRLAQDFEFAFRMCATELPQKFERQIVLSELRECLDSVKLGGEEGQYELIDFSMHTWGLPDFSTAPMELVLVDKLHLEGISPSHGNTRLPLPYCPIQLAEYLIEQGYEGSFVDLQVDFLETKQTSVKSQKNSQNEPGEQSHGTNSLKRTEEPRWSKYCEIPSQCSESQRHLPMPPASLRLRQKAPQNTEEPSQPLHFSSNIILHPVHPSNIFRMGFLRSCCARSDFRAILASFWFWAQSWNLDQLTPTVCGFIVVAYLQKFDSLPPLKGLSSKSGLATPATPLHYWARHILPSNSDPVYYRNEVPMLTPVPPPRNSLRNTSSLLAEFFEYWALDGGGGPRCRDFIFSINDGKEVARAAPYGQPQKREKFWNRLEKANKLYFSGEYFGFKNVQSPIWRFQALVIEDPFVAHHNAAHSVANSTLLQLRKQLRIASELLKNGRSPLETFGPAITESHITKSYTANMQGIEDFFCIVPLETTVHERRNLTMKLVNDVVRRSYGRDYHVECFGSTRYGVDSATSDLDLVIVDARRPLGFCYDTSLPAIYNIRDLGRSLQQGGFKIEEVIPQAAVPIVKFYDPRCRIQCDINVNDQLGLFNTEMIAHYCELFPPLTALLLAIKKWAKSLGLNNPSGRGGTTSFSSYALSIMTIGFLQTSGILPSLQVGLPPLPLPPKNPEKDVEGVFWQRERNGPPKRCDRRFIRLQAWRPQEGSKLDTYSLLLGWFRYWGHEHEYATQLMSIRDGALFARPAKAPNKKKEKRKASRKSKGKAENGTEDDNATPVKDESPSRTESPSIGMEDLDIEDDLEEKSEESEDEEVKVEDPEGEGSAEEISIVDLANGKQPRQWKNASLVVGDPFILTKNVTGSVTQRIIGRFKAECRRAVILLEHGGAFEDLLGTGEPLAGRPRDGRNGRAAGGRVRPAKTVQVEAKQATTTLRVQTMVKQEHNVSI